MGQGGVAVEDLDEEPVDDGRRGQETGVAPGVSGGAAGGADDVVAEPGGKILSERAEDAKTPSMHRGASCAMGVGEKTHGARRPRSSQVPRPLGFSGLNAIRVRPLFGVWSARRCMSDVPGQITARRRRRNPSPRPTRRAVPSPMCVAGSGTELNWRSSETT